ncbi:hypothetical protein A3Q56_04589 [Intoshia linei]|uniref:N-acetyltransferase domain-containing protein n=1 Tax=Intoshia linei TaxID=1819745 RepID=A0A177B2N2_9BILA|nr:hypothetical protein A3Q56_04589 [Intoshia linei]
MEVSENLAHYFKNKITLFHTLNIPKIGYINRDNGYESKKNEQLYSILDILGRESARAQNLNKPVTTRFDILNTNNRLYVLSEKDENKM